MFIPVTPLSMTLIGFVVVVAIIFAAIIIIAVKRIL